MRALLAVAALVAGVASQSPYAGEPRQIKALSEEQIAGYLNGDGMGYALSAELNSYPGPKHVLEFGDELDLSSEQRRAVSAAFERMHERARELGARLVEFEGQLDAAFAGRSISAADLEAQLAELGRVNAELRFVHLRAHLETTGLLSAAQIDKYGMLRGYDDHAGHRLMGSHAARQSE